MVNVMVWKWDVECDGVEVGWLVTETRGHGVTRTRGDGDTGRITFFVLVSFTECASGHTSLTDSQVIVREWSHLPQ